MKKRQKTPSLKTSIPKERRVKKETIEQPKDILSVDSVSSLEASSISSSSSCCSPNTTPRDHNIADTWIDSQPCHDSVSKQIEQGKSENALSTPVSTSQDSPRNDDSKEQPSENNSTSSETRSESPIHHKPIQKKKHTNQKKKYIEKTKWSVWKTIIGWFGKQSQQENVE